MTTQTVTRVARLDVAEHIATITLCDPAGLNPIGEAWVRDLPECLRDAHGDPDVRVIMLRAEGSAFCVGGDLAGLGADPAKAHDLLTAYADAINSIIRMLHESPLVTIAVVHGPAAGGGLGFMASADVVLASTDAFFSVAYGRIALTPDAGTSYFMARDVGYRKALELYLTSERFGPDRALELGLINRVVAADRLNDEATALARRIAAGPTGAITQAKRLLRNASTEVFARQLEDEMRTIADATRTQEFHDGVTAFLGKRQPTSPDQGAGS